MRTVLIATAVLGLVSCTGPASPNEPLAPTLDTVKAVFSALVPLPPGVALLPPGPGRLTLSNFSYDRARVESFVTGYPDCELHPGMVATSFELPLNGTRVIDAPPGSDICWRRIEPPLAETMPPGTIPPPVPWNRSYTGVAHILDARL